MSLISNKHFEIFSSLLDEKSKVLILWDDSFEQIDKLKNDKKLTLSVAFKDLNQIDNIKEMNCLPIYIKSYEDLLNMELDTYDFIIIPEGFLHNQMNFIQIIEKCKSVANKIIICTSNYATLRNRINLLLFGSFFIPYPFNSKILPKDDIRLWFNQKLSFLGFKEMIHICRILGLKIEKSLYLNKNNNIINAFNNSHNTLNGRYFYYLISDGSTKTNGNSNLSFV